jgi:gliding motility-associated-like protein
MDNTVEVIQKAAPAKPVTLETDTVFYCSGETGYNLAITNAEEGVTYQVYDNSDNFVIGTTGTSDATLEVANLPEGAYVVRASWGGDACISDNSDSVWVFQAPDPVVLMPFEVDETIFRSDNTVNYTFEADALQEGVTYWLINETTPSDTIEFVFEAISKIVTITEPGSYRLEGFFAGYGCQPVTMNGRLEVLDFEWMSEDDIPNAFSPNDDGFNDYFIISTGRLILDQSKLEVFNRWGTLVYRSKGRTYDNLWDGTSNVNSMISIGDKLPNGVYFYVFTIKAIVGGEDDDAEIVSNKFNGFIELRR